MSTGGRDAQPSGGVWSWGLMRGGRSPDRAVARHVAELRQETLRLLLILGAAGWLAFLVGLPQVVDTRSETPDVTLRHWLLGLMVMAGFLLSHRLRHRWPNLAAGCFLATAAGALVGGLLLRGSPTALALVPALALAAVVLLGPLAGLAVGVGTLAAVALPWANGQLPWLGGDRLVEAALATAATLVVAWALARNLYQAVAWSAASHAEAWRKTEEARQNRAELVQALKQLDHAYYRLQRANAALELAWKAADAAERAKTEFATTISHELRTPLNLIIGFSELMLTAPASYGAPLPPGYRGDLYAIFRSAQHLLTLADDVIDLARIGMGRLALVREPVDLGQVIADACELVRAFVEAKGLWLRIAVEPGLPALSLDRLRIRQVLLNLLTNAARFTVRGGIAVAAGRDGDRVMVTVADTGPGIAPGDLPKVFEEFYSAGPAPRPDGLGLGGIGLGLPLSREFVRLHGGAIGVDSVPDRGSTFWFTLPLEVAAAAATPARRGRLAPALAGPERCLVLAVDDRQLAAFLQRHLGDWRVLTAAGLADAVAVAVEVRAQAIVSDLDAEPGEVAGLPVPLVRLPLPRGERLAVALGAAGHLVKPVTREALQAAIAGLGRPIGQILLVDDDPDFVRLLERMLRATAALPAGCVIRRAHTGREALAALAADPPDLVLLDLVMPELGGDEVLRRLRAGAPPDAPPVILLSGQDQLQAQFPLHGPVSVVSPEGFRLDELLGVIEALLGALRPPRAYLTAGSTST